MIRTNCLFLSSMPDDKEFRFVGKILLFFLTDRVIYARKGADEIGGGLTTIDNGEKITQELASVSY